MSGFIVKYIFFLKINNICIVIKVKDGIDIYDYEEVVRIVGLKIGVYVGEVGREVELDEVIVYEIKLLLK